MHILLTDVLACPRCGPEFGLIVLADRMEDRLVMAGRLGCANCREEYPVEAGMADLRTGGIDDGEEASSGDPDPEDTGFRTAALLGVDQGMGVVLVLTRSPELVDRVAALLPNAQVVGVSRSRPARAAGAGWILWGRRLPFRDRSLRGVALLGPHGGPAALEAARTVAPGARVVLEPAQEDGRQVVADEGLEVILDQEGVVVASAPGPG